MHCGGRVRRLANVATKQIETAILEISVNFSFSIADLKKSIPGAGVLASLSGEELLAGLRRVLGDAAKDSVVTVEGDIVTVTPNPVVVANSAEAARLSERAAIRARKGELDKAAGIYRHVLELDPTRHDSRRELAMCWWRWTATAASTGMDVAGALAPGNDWGNPRALRTFSGISAA